MTRARATEAGVPTDLMRQYYAQRASAGLIVTECTQVSDQGHGIIRAPGLHRDDQVEGWRKVTRYMSPEDVSTANCGTRAGLRIQPCAVASCRIVGRGYELWTPKIGRAANLDGREQAFSPRWENVM